MSLIHGGYDKVPRYHVVCDGPDKTKAHTLIGYMPVKVSHGYGSPFDGTEHHFCSIECLHAWLTPLMVD